MLTAELIPLGETVAVILPPEVFARLNLAVGDLIRVTETPNGLALSPDRDPPDGPSAP